MRTRPRFLMAMAAFGLVARATTAEAYTVETVVTPGCHEAITMNALRAARVATSAAAPLPLVTSDDAAMAADLPYTPASDMQDLGAIALVLGVRSVDLQGASFDALDQIAIIQGDPTTQDQHCLRNGGDVEPNGTLEAIGQCRAFIVGQVAAALAYLGPDGAPSASLRTGLDVSLSIRGEVTVPLPGFYVNMGQALHALEDSFAHTFRADAAGPITASLNFLELTTGDVDQAVDGPPHRTGLDVCQGLDPERQAKLTAAESAATSILVAALSRGTNDERMANVDAVLDTYLAYKPGCTAANSWCDAPEQAYEETPSCSIGWGAKPLGMGIALTAVGLVLAFRRRSRRRGPRGRALGLFCGVTVGSVAATVPAHAGEVTAEDEEPVPEERGSRWGLTVTTGAALDHAALMAAVGARFGINHAWLAGVDVEYNPWVSLTGPTVTAGAFNAYASGIHRWTSATTSYDLRTSLRVGSSTSLMALFGVPLGATGVYVGGNLLGIEFHLPRHLALVVEPAEVAYPVPQLRGTPFGYLQYRVTVALQWGADR